MFGRATFFGFWAQLGKAATLRKQLWLMETALAAQLWFCQAGHVNCANAQPCADAFHVFDVQTHMRGQNVWHEGSRFASIKVLNSHTCVLIMDEDDVRGYLSADGHEIEWEDGDRWRRARKITKDTDEIQKPVSISETNMQECVSPEALIKEHRSTDHTTSSEQSQLAVDSLLQRDALSLQRLLNNGMCADTCIDPSPLWTDIGWTPEGDSQRTPTPLLVAAILLQWPEARKSSWAVLGHESCSEARQVLQGVRICVDRKANVNGTYVCI